MQTGQQPVLLYAMFGRRIVPSKGCKTKKEQRKEVLRVRELVGPEVAAICIVAPEVEATAVAVADPAVAAIARCSGF